MADLQKRYPVITYDDKLMSILPQPEVAAEDTLKTKPQKELKIKSITPIEKGKGNK